jgi:hypothetical protein
MADLRPELIADYVRGEPMVEVRQIIAEALAEFFNNEGDLEYIAFDFEGTAAEVLKALDRAGFIITQRVQT